MTLDNIHELDDSLIITFTKQFVLSADIVQPELIASSDTHEVLHKRVPL